MCAGFGASPNRALQRPAHSVQHTPSAWLNQAPSTAKRASRPASDHPCLRTPPHLHPRFRPTRNRGRPDNPKPSVPPTPRHPAATANPAAASTQPGRTQLVAIISPRWLHSTLNGSGRRSAHTPPRHHRSPTSPEHAADTNTSPSASRPRSHPKFQQRTQLQRRNRQCHETDRKSLMKSAQTSLFQRFDAESEL